MNMKEYYILLKGKKIKLEPYKTNNERLERIEIKRMLVNIRKYLDDNRIDYLTVKQMNELVAKTKMGHYPPEELLNKIDKFKNGISIISVNENGYMNTLEINGEEYYYFVSNESLNFVNTSIFKKLEDELVLFYEKEKYKI